MKKPKKFRVMLIMLCGLALCFFLPFKGNVIHAQSEPQYSLDVTKTASITYTREFDWMITKSGEHTELTLAPEQIFSENYEVAVDTTGHIDFDHMVEGTITIENNTPIDATITGIEDILTPYGIPVISSCSVPVTLASGETLNCSYSADLPNWWGECYNTVTVTTSGEVGGGTYTEEVVYGSPKTIIDGCIDVTDDLRPDPNLGTVCIEDVLPVTYKYNLDLGPFNDPNDCDGIQIMNTASYTEDGGFIGSASHTVTIDVACDFGCTLTKGYWKTHNASFKGGGSIKKDDTWELIGPLAELEIFFLSGQTFFEVLWTPTAGNPYYILAAQYIAAELNILSGAVPDDVLTVMTDATSLLGAYSPDEVADLKGKDKKEWTELATILDYYNNGIIGPGHCSEESVPVSESVVALKSVSSEETDVILGKDLSVENYPNPFDNSTTFSFELPQNSEVELTIFTISGQKMTVLTKGFYPAGKHQIIWQAPYDLSPGMYLYRLQAGSSYINKMLILK